MVPAVEQDGERLANIGWVVGDKGLTNGRLAVVVQLDVVGRAPGKVLREVVLVTEVDDGLEAEALEHGKVDLERVAAAVDAGCDKLERERGNYELL